MKLTQVGPLTTLQDGGRPGYSRFGAPASGPMDRGGYHRLLRAMGPAPSSVVEISAAGLSLTCVEGAAGAGVWAPGFRVHLNDATIPSYARTSLRMGDQLRITPTGAGNWAYLALSGTTDAPAWLGSISTYQSTDLAGRTFGGGDLWELNDAVEGDLGIRPLNEPDARQNERAIRVVLGPQERCFTPSALSALTSEPFRVTTDYNRMGVRLEGPKLTQTAGLNLPTEGVVRGALQVPAHGDPICLMADHQTTGGYPKIATVISADLDLLAQRPPGSAVRFKAVTPKEAVEAARKAHNELQSASIEGPSNDLGGRLSSENLIDGVIDPKQL